MVGEQGAADRATPRLRRGWLFGAATGILAGSALIGGGQLLGQGNDSASQGQAEVAPGGELSGGRPKFGPPPGMTLFQENCAACHTKAGMEIGGRHALSLESLNAMAPERIFDAMVTGKMMQQASALSREEKKQIATFLAGRPFTDAAGTDVKAMTNVCKTNPAFKLTGNNWRGWSPGTDNARFQPAAAAGLKPGDVPKLKLKWAFGVPQGASLFSQPAVAGGRLFFGGDNGTVYSIDAATGCAYWSFHTEGGVRTAPVVAPIAGRKESAAVFFATQGGTVMAVGAQSGTLLWKSQPSKDPHGLTGSLAYHGGRIYVPFTGTETMAGADPNYECCKSRGAVASVDANTGKLIWYAETIQEPIVSRGKNEIGKPMWGPAGASVWNTPTVDPKRGLVYVGTGNGFSYPAASTTDSIVALDINTGKIRWHHQEVRDDAFVLGCPDTAPQGNHCPEKLGPDWDFGGASVILKTLPNGRDIVIGSGKHGIAVAVDPDQQGKLVWRTKLYGDTPPTADGLVIFGGAADDAHVYYPLQRPGGGLHALDLATGKIDWTTPLRADGRGQIGPASAIPGVVFTGGWDGIIRAVDTSGKLIWSFNTKQDFKTINGIPGKGGSLGQAGATVVNGTVYVTSGYIGMQNGSAGNVILAFTPQ